VGSEPAVEQFTKARPRVGRHSILFATAYFLHLVVPALLLADVLAAWHRKLIPLQLGDLGSAVAAVATVWLIAAVVLWLRFAKRRSGRSHIANVLCTVYAAYSILIVLEVALRLTLPPPPLPGLVAAAKHIFNIDPADAPGVQGRKTVTINRLGLRGPLPPKRAAAYRIVTIGGSTTACTILDDSEEWPHLLMERLNANPSGRRAWVGNAAVDGMTTVQHLALTQWLPGEIDSDMFILLIGINDLQTTLTHRGAPTEAILRGASSYGFQGDLPPGTKWRSRPLYARLRVARVVRDAVRRLENLKSSPKTAPKVVPSFPARDARPLPTVPIPDLSVGLGEYRSRILALADRCRNLGLRCLFMTQPYIWRATLTPAERHLLRLGWVGPAGDPIGYAAPGDLARALDTYNQTLLNVCAENGLECFDLAPHIPKDVSTFYDDVHFNESGARLVAQNVAAYLLSAPPFR
jgi:lysophospholipase L1-like esterase